MFMKKYELMVTLPGTLDEKEAEKRIQEVVQLVKEHAEGVELSTLGKNRLAYPIKQIRYGYFYIIPFSVETEQLRVLQQKLALSRELLRAQISYFKNELSPNQKAAYSTGSLGVTMMNDRENTNEERVASPVFVPQNTPPKEEKKVDMDEIKKKLDQILEETDIIPGV